MGVPTVQQFMTNLRQVWQRLTTGARDTSQSAGAYLDRQRKVMALRADLRKARGDRGDLYTVMGRKVYALHRKDKVANKDLLRSCQEIDELNTLMEAKQTQIDALLALADEEEIYIEDDTELPEDKGEPDEAEEEEETEQAAEDEEEKAAQE
jgi:hypothetical protein